MAQADRRLGQNGVRWTAVYRDATGKRRSAGTFDNEAKALEVAQARESYSPAAGAADPAFRATVSIARYAEMFVALSSASPVTRSNYAVVLDNHIVPFLGKIRVSELDSQTCRQWVKDLKNPEVCRRTTPENPEARKPPTQRRARKVLSAMMTMAKEDGYRPKNDNPAYGLRTDDVARKPVTVLTVEQYDALHRALPTLGAKCMAWLTVQTGGRFGEITELRPADIDFTHGVVGFHRAVSEVGAAWHPDGRSRFVVNVLPKDKEEREVSVDPTILVPVSRWIAGQQLASGDLLFHHDRVLPERGVFPAKLEREEITPAKIAELDATIGYVYSKTGIRHSHATVGGYVTCGCRCEWCRAGYNAYSAERKRTREAGQRTRSRRARYSSINTTGHISRSTWRLVWIKAIEEAQIPFRPTAYQLRHTHASWLINLGEDPKTVMARLGHSDLSITSRYVHKLPEDRSSAALMANLGLAF